MAEPTPEQLDLFWSMGDVNRDGKIDQTDLDMINAAYGSLPGYPNWNENCDLNKDGKVDNIDLYNASQNYGKDIWTYFGLEPEPQLNIGLIALALTGLLFGGYLLLRHKL